MAGSFFPNSVDRLFCSLRNTDVARSDIQLARVQRLLLVALMVVLVAAFTTRHRAVLTELVNGSR